MEKWLTPLLQATALKHSYAFKAQDKELFLERTKKEFVETVRRCILERCKDTPSVEIGLQKTIFKGEIGTILDRICMALYKNYIETDTGAIEIFIGQYTFKKFDISVAKFIGKIRSAGPSIFENEVMVEPSFCPNSKSVTVKLAVLSPVPKELQQ
jgi:hypothetical protein